MLILQSGNSLPQQQARQTCAMLIDSHQPMTKLRKDIMSEQEVPAEAGSFISFAVAWRGEDNKLTHVDPEMDKANPPKGEPVVICELPPIVAYEMGWALGLYARTLDEVDETQMDEAQLAETRARSQMIRNISEHIRDGVVAANALLDENWADEYKFDTEETSDDS